MVQFKINNQNVVAALDTGDASLRCVVAYKEPSSPLEILAYVEEESQGLQRGRIVDFNSAVPSIGKILEAAEEASKTSFSELWVGLSCPFHSFSSQGMAALPLREVRKKDMDLAVETACAVPLPDRHVKIHSLPQMFSVDGEAPVLNPLGLSGLRLETSVHIVTILQSYYKDLTKTLKFLGCSPKGFIHNLVAFSENSLTEDQKKEGVCFCDIGCDSTQAVVYNEGRILNMFEINMGGNDFSRAVANQFKISLPEAEKLKIQYGRFFSQNISEEDQIEIGNQGLFLSYKSFIQTLEKTAIKLLHSAKEHLQSQALLENIKSGFIFTGQTAFSPGFLNLANLELGAPVLQNMGSDTHSHNFKQKNTLSIIQQAFHLENMKTQKVPGNSPWAKLRELF